MNNEVVCFLPCRSGSQRVSNKNTKRFSSFENGLVELKLNQLLSCSSISRVVLSTNDQRILNFARSLNSSRLNIYEREKSLCSSNTSTDDLVHHAYSLIPDSHILWTHVTSPFVNSFEYDKIISVYFEKIANGFDSLMTSNEIFGFLWREGKPFNYSRHFEKWPRTQTMVPVHEINSAAFLAHSSIYKIQQDRIGSCPYIYAFDGYKGFDIDWPEQFQIAEIIAEKGLALL